MAYSWLIRLLLTGQLTLDWSAYSWLVGLLLTGRLTLDWSAYSWLVGLLLTGWFTLDRSAYSWLVGLLFLTGRLTLDWSAYSWLVSLLLTGRLVWHRMESHRSFNTFVGQKDCRAMHTNKSYICCVIITGSPWYITFYIYYLFIITLLIFVQ